MPMKTYVATPTDRERNWLLVDAEGQTLGRLATQIADALRGKRKPDVHAAHRHRRLRRGHQRREDLGDRQQARPRSSTTATPATRAACKSRTLDEMLERRPEEVIRLAVKGMLPRNRLGPQAAHQAQGLRRARPSARGAAAATDGDRDLMTEERPPWPTRRAPTSQRARGARRRGDAGGRGARRRGAAGRRGAVAEEPAAEAEEAPAEEPAAEEPAPAAEAEADAERRGRGPTRSRGGARPARQAGDPRRRPRGRHRPRGRGRPARRRAQYDEDDEDAESPAEGEDELAASRSPTRRSTSPPTRATARPASARPPSRA